MADMQNYEFVVAQAIEGKWLLRRILAIAGYVFFVVAVFTVGFVSRLGVPMLALTPIFLWMLVFFTWRYTCPEYELTTVSNTLRFAIIYGGRTRRPQMEVEFRRMIKIAPLDAAGEAELARFKPEQVWSAVSSMHAPDLYYALWPLEDEAKKKRYAVLYFEATEQMLKICRYYNSAATVLAPVSR